MTPKNSLKLAAAALVVSALMPLVASADAVSDLQAQIKTLLNQISQLSGGSSSSTSSSATPATSNVSSQASAGGAYNFSCPSLFRSLSVGASGEDVANLQAYLQAAGYFSGNVTGYFGQLTQAAIQRFQSARGIVSGGDPASTGFGVVGALTRAAISSTCKSSTTTTQAPTCPVAPQPTTICSTGWQAQVDANGCVLTYKCSVPINSGSTPSSSCSVGYVLQNGVCISSVACTAISLVCPAGQTDHVDANCHHSCGSISTTGSGTFSASPLSGLQPLTVTFTGTGPSGYSIDFGDNTPAQSTGCIGQCGSPMTISTTHVYTTLGTYTAKLTYGGNVLGTATVTTVAQTQPGYLSANPSAGAPPLVVSFNGRALADSGATTEATAWIDYGDGNTDNSIGIGQFSRTHTYANTGTFIAKLQWRPYGQTSSNFPTYTTGTATITTSLSACAIDCAAGYHQAADSTCAAPHCIPN